MRLSFILFFALVFSQSTLAQESVRPAEVSMKDLTMKSYPLDTSASAVILFETGENSIIDVNYDYRTTFKHFVRIKILKKEAIDKYGIIRIAAIKNTLSKIKGTTYSLENGIIVKSELQEKAIFKTKEGRRLSLTSFSLPNITVGSIIEYSYMRKQDGGQFHFWPFQTSIPVQFSTYSLTFDGYHYSTDFRGSIKLFRYDSSNHTKTWTMKDIPAFAKEPLMPDPQIYQSSLKFWHLYDSWKSVNQVMMDNPEFSKALKGSDSLKKRVDSVLVGITDPRKKIQALSNFVKQRVTWDSTRDYLATTPWKIYNQKNGTSGDINILLGNLLKKAGFTVNLVLLSTRQNGLIMEGITSAKQFDYVITQVKLDSTTTLLLDATEKRLPYDVLPAYCLNYKGFLVDSLNWRWIEIKPTNKEKSKTTVNAELQINEQGELHGKIIFTKDGYDALTSRVAFDEKGKAAYTANLLADKNWRIEKTEIEQMEDKDKAIKEIHDVTIDNLSTVAGDLIYFNPFVALRTETNPFVSPTRNYPIDFGVPVEKVLNCTFLIPEGYEVDQIPQSKVIKMDNNSARALFQISHTGNRILIYSALQINETLFTKAEYVTLREFYARLVSKSEEQVVLKRKK